MTKDKHVESKPNTPWSLNNYLTVKLTQAGADIINTRRRRLGITGRYNEGDKYTDQAWWLLSILPPINQCPRLYNMNVEIEL